MKGGVVVKASLLLWQALSLQQQMYPLCEQLLAMKFNKGCSNTLTALAVVYEYSTRMKYEVGLGLYCLNVLLK